MTLGEKLAAARQAKGLTQAQAAGDVITRNMLSLLEHDQAEPSLSTLRHLARTLEVPLSWLLDGGGEALEAARTAFLAGDWKRCLDILAAETTPLTEEGQLLRLRAALRAAREALERGDPEAGAPLLEQAEGWLPATAYATPWEAAELARLRLRLALDRGLTPEDQRAWEASAAPAEAARQLLLARCALAQGKLREASQALRRSDGAPEAERALLQGLLEAAWGHPREAAAHLSRAEAGDLTLPDRRRCLEALEQSALALEDYQLAYTCAAKARSLGSTADGPSTMPR